MHHYFASIEDRKWNLPREGMVARNQTLELHEILFTPYLLIIILTNDHNHKKQRNENMHVHHVLYMTPIGHLEASTLPFEMEKWSILPDGFMFESLIKGHCKICNKEAALTLFHEMERRGIAANLFCYTNISFHFLIYLFPSVAAPTLLGFFLHST